MQGKFDFRRYIANEDHRAAFARATHCEVHGRAEPDRFKGVSYRENDRGIVVLDGTVAHIECEKRSAVPAGDHTIFIGLVVGGDVTDRRPLLYYRGGYAGLSR